MTRIERFAQHYRLKVTRDECHDQVIEGRRGHLYFDGANLCLMALNARVSGMSTASIRGLSGKCWIGDIWRDEKRRGHRDVKVQWIPEANWRKAIALCRVRARRIIPESERAAMAARLKAAIRPEKPPVYAVESRRTPLGMECQRATGIPSPTQS